MAELAEDVQKVYDGICLFLSPWRTRTTSAPRVRLSDGTVCPCVDDDHAIVEYTSELDVRSDESVLNQTKRHDGCAFVERIDVLCTSAAGRVVMALQTKLLTLEGAGR